MADFVMLLLFFGGFIALFVMILRYLRTVHILLKELEAHHNAVYEALGRPRIYVALKTPFGRHVLSSSPLSSQLKFFRWLFRREYGSLERERSRALAEEVQKRFIRTVVFFCVFVIAFLVAFVLTLL